MENNEEIYVHMKIYDIRKATSKKRVRVKRKRETSWNQKDKNHRAAKEQKKKNRKFFSENTNQIFHRTRAHDNVYFLFI